MVIVLWFCTASTFADYQPKRLPMPVVQSICAKYEGAPAFRRNGELAKIDCPYVDRLGEINKPTLMESYHRILENAKTLSELRTFGGLPSDLSCGEFKERQQGTERVVDCSSMLAEQSVPFVFVADARGRLLRVETTFNFEHIYRLAMERAVRRGSVSEFYEPYVNLHVDLLVEKLRLTSSEGDEVTLKDGGIVAVVVRAAAEAKR